MTLRLLNFQVAEPRAALVVLNGADISIIAFSEVGEQALHTRMLEVSDLLNLEDVNRTRSAKLNAELLDADISDEEWLIRVCEFLTVCEKKS